MEPFLSGQNKTRFVKKSEEELWKVWGVSRKETPWPAPVGFYGTYRGNKVETGVIFIGIGFWSHHGSSQWRVHIPCTCSLEPTQAGERKGLTNSRDRSHVLIKELTTHHGLSSYCLGEQTPVSIILLSLILNVLENAKNKKQRHLKQQNKQTNKQTLRVSWGKKGNSWESVSMKSHGVPKAKERGSQEARKGWRQCHQEARAECSWEEHS